MFHVFTNEKDIWTEDEHYAYEVYNKWVEEYDCARIYWTEEPEDEGECIEAHGGFPA